MNNLTRRSLIKSALVVPFALQAAKSDLFAQSGKINYWHHFTSETEFKGMERVISLFSSKYPNVGLTQENIPNADFMAKFTSGVLANARADTSMVTSDRLPDMVAMDGLVPITKNVNSWNLKKYFPANRWEGVTIDGEIYGIPAFTFVDWMYYRKDWFDEAGISGPPKTFDEFVNAAIKLTDPSKGRYGFGMRGGGGGQMFILDMIESFGSKIVVDGEVAIDRKKMIDGIRWYSDLMTKHKVVPPSAPGDSYRQIMEGFKTGQTAMVWHHTGSLTEIGGALQAGQQFMSATRPAGPDQHVARLAYLYNGIMTERNFDASWAWISFWAELDPTIAFLEETGYFPSSAQVAEDVRISGNIMYKAAVDTLSFGRLPPKFIGVSGWASGTVLPEFQKILVGDSTVENAVDRMIKGLEETL
jgi:multiple sugar transport system substrate-binding protein